MQTRFWAIPRGFLLLALCAAAAWGVDWKSIKPDGYVNDLAQVIDPETEARLEAYCGEVEQTTGVQLALVTVPSLEGESIEDAAGALFRAWGVGSKQSNEGVLLLLSIGDHRSRLEVGYGLEPILPDGLAGSVLREMRPALRQERYGEAMMAAAETLRDTIARAKNIPSNSAPAPLPRKTKPSFLSAFPFVVIFGGFALMMVLGWLGRMRGYRGSVGGDNGLLAAMLMSSALNRSSWGDQGGGGFGGYDSSDSFGGFGGGDSGGGGASSSW